MTLKLRRVRRRLPNLPECIAMRNLPSLRHDTGGIGSDVTVELRKTTGWSEAGCPVTMMARRHHAGKHGKTTGVWPAVVVGPIVNKPGDGS